MNPENTLKWGRQTEQIIHNFWEILEMSLCKSLELEMLKLKVDIRNILLFKQTENAISENY